MAFIGQLHVGASLEASPPIGRCRIAFSYSCHSSIWFLDRRGRFGGVVAQGRRVNMLILVLPHFLVWKINYFNGKIFDTSCYWWKFSPVENFPLYGLTWGLLFKSQANSGHYIDIASKIKIKFTCKSRSRGIPPLMAGVPYYMKSSF